jgi:hypothetical protein
MPRRLLLVGLVALAAAMPAFASAPPVGPLPKGPVTTINVQRDELFGIALPRPTGGNVWRIARHYDGRIVSEVSEGEQRGNIVGAYRALRPGKATIVAISAPGEARRLPRPRLARGSPPSR